MRPWLILVILLLEAWAITRVLGSARATSGKAVWILGIILLPVVGVLAWFGWGIRGQTARTAAGATRLP